MKKGAGKISLHKLKRDAHRAVKAAILTGKITRGSCVKCGSEKAYAHHEDYSKPLDIVWLCCSHHQKLHMEEKRKNRHKLLMSLPNVVMAAKPTKVVVTIRVKQAPWDHLGAIASSIGIPRQKLIDGMLEEYLSLLKKVIPS